MIVDLFSAFALIMNTIEYDLDSSGGIMEVILFTKMYDIGRIVHYLSE